MNGRGVLLLTGDEWGTIAPALRRRIEEGVERVREAREAIARDARVGWMPPVSIESVVWSPGDGGAVHAQSGIYPAPRNGYAIATLASVNISLCPDPTLVRLLLAHEFAHCFTMARMVMDHLDLGLDLDLTGDPQDPRREARMLADGPYWLGEADANLMGWNDPRAEPLGVEVAALANARQLRLTLPPGRTRVPRASLRNCVPVEWAEHVRSYRDI